MASRQPTGTRISGQAAEDDPPERARELLEMMRGAALDAAAFIRERSADLATLSWRSKSPSDFVSEVDVGAERILRDRLLRAVPNATIIGEELSPGAASTGGGTVFLVDPLDGTTNFLHGYPEYAVSIAALVEGRLSAGIVLDVPHGDVFTAIAGGGAYRNAERIAVSTVTEPARALIGTGFPFRRPELLPGYLRQFSRVTTRTAGIRRAGSAALDLADVACGRFDAFWELVLSPWDFAAGILLVREAGGVATDVGGADVRVAESSVLAGNPVMYAWLRDILGGAHDP